MRYGLTAGKLDLRLSAGYDSIPEFGVLDGPENHDFWRMARVNLRSTYHFDKERSLDVDAGYEDGVQGGPAELAYLSGATYASARWFPQAHFLRVRYTQQKTADDVWYIQYLWNQERWDKSDGGLHTIYNQHDLEAQRTQRLDERNVLTYGGNVRIDLMESGDLPVGYGQQGLRFVPGNSQDLQGGLFAQDRFDLNEQWALVGGIRTDVNAYTGWEWSGRGAVLFSPAKEHTFRAAVARAFRTPTMVERKIDIRYVPTGYPAPYPQYGAEVLGNENLNATYVKSFELGYTYEKKNLRLNAEFFYDDYRGIMATVQQTAAGVIPVVKQYMNVVDGHLYGFELSGQYQVSKNVRVDGSYVWEKWVQSSDRAVATPLNADTALPPQQKVGAGVSWEPLPGLTLNGRMWWVGEITTYGPTRIPAYSRFDFNVAKKLGKNCEVALGVQNAFDSRHLEMTNFGFEPLEVGERTVFVRFQEHF